MTGKVVAINEARGMVGVLTEDEDFSVFELLNSDEIEVGDEVAWVGTTPLGGEKITNVTRGQTLDVFFQNHHVSKANLRGQLLF